MTRFKKELEKKGFRLEHNEMTLPAADGLDSVVVDAASASITYYYHFIAVKMFFNRAMEVVREEFD